MTHDNLPGLDLDDDEEKRKFKAIFKEAIREWAEEKYAAVGRFTIHGVLVAVIVGLAYLAFILNHGLIPVQKVSGG